MDFVFLQSFLNNLFFLPIFLLAIIIAWYIPGRVVIKGLFQKKSDAEKIILAIIVGMVIWGYQALLFGYLNARFLTYIYLLIFMLIWIRTRSTKRVLLNIKVVSVLKENYLLILIFLFGVIGQTQQFLITGFIFSDGIHVFTGSSDDVFWHSALINQLASNVPPYQPGMVPIIVKNYHYISNLIVADLIRVFHLPLLPTQFQYMNIFLSLMIGLVGYILGQALKLSKKGVIFLVFIFYFSSDVIYLISFVGRGVFEFGVHPLEDGTMLLENPPRAFANIVVLTSVVFLIELLKKKDIRAGLLLSLLAGITIGLKVHHGILILSSLGFLSLYFLMTRQIKMLIYPLLAVLISALVYLPVNKGAGLPVFVLFEISRILIAEKRLGFTHLELARQIYEQHNNFLQVWRMYLTMLLIFLIGEFGIKNIGFIPLRKTIKKITTPVYLFLYGGILATIIFGTFFIQPVAGADIFNFYLSSSLFLGVLTAVSIDRWLSVKNKSLFILMISLILVITIPRWIYKTLPITQYASYTKPVISAEELKAMDFVKKRTEKEALVLVVNKGQWDSMYPYVSVFTNRAMFLSGQVIMSRHGVSYTQREKVVSELQNTKNTERFKELLEDNKITHLYFYGEPDSQVVIPQIIGKKIFYNNTITIYKVTK